MIDPDLILLVCYRYYAWDTDYDSEAVWQFVQRHGGHISVRPDSIDFYIPRRYQVMFELAYPDLVRQRSLDFL